MYGPRPTARYVPPGSTERGTRGARVPDPYARLLDARIVFLGTRIDDAAANDAATQLLHLEHAAPDRDVSLYINAPGGSFTAMTALYDTMRYLDCDIETVCLGQAASAAAALLAAGTPGKRLALPGARIVIHEPALTGPVHGETADLLVQARELLRHRALLEDLYVRHTGRDPATVRADLERETVFDASAARAYGLVDHITVPRKGQPAAWG